jgi:hypothetical protein
LALWERLSRNNDTRLAQVIKRKTKKPRKDVSVITGAGFSNIATESSGGGSSTLDGLTDVTITSVADLDIIQYDNTSAEWINATLTHAGLPDINTGDRQLGGHTYATRRYQAAGSPAVTDDTPNFLVGDIWTNTTTDVSYICSDNSTGAAIWTSITGGGSIALNDLTDVTITSVAAGDTFYYNGSTWVNFAKGSDGQVFTLASGIPSWATPATYIGGSTGSTDNVMLRSDGTGGATLQDSSWGVANDGELTNILFSAGSSRVMSTRVSGDAFSRFEQRANGKILWGLDGTSAPDAVLYRIDADTVGVVGDSIDIGFHASTFLKVTNAVAITPDADEIAFQGTTDLRPFAYNENDAAFDLGRTVKSWHIAEGTPGATTNNFNCNYKRQDTSNAASGDTPVYTTNSAVNFATGAVLPYLTSQWKFFRWSNVLYNSSDFVLFAPFQKDGDTVQASIIMRQNASHTGAHGLLTITLHITDGTTVSSAPVGQFSTLDGTFRTFTTGEVDVSAYGDTLQWVLKINGNNTSTGTNYNESMSYDYHSVLVEQWSE